MRNQFLLLKPSSLWNFVTAALADKYNEIHPVSIFGGVNTVICSRWLEGHCFVVYNHSSGEKSKEPLTLSDSQWYIFISHIKISDGNDIIKMTEVL